VVVFAVSERPDGQESEALLATMPVKLGESVVIEETEQYSALPVTVAVHRP
jgi:hypothetical protein